MIAAHKHPSVFYAALVWALLFCALVLPATAHAAPADLDPTFSGDGLVTTALEGVATAEAVAIQADGKIITAGDRQAASDLDFLLVRHNADGSIDNTFDTDGEQTTDFGSLYEGARSIAIQPDGKILAAGYSNTGAAGNDFALARYNSDGSLDLTFNTTGKVLTAFGGDFDLAQKVVVQADGKILAVGGGGAGNDFTLARYNSDGSPDLTFNLTGKQTTNFGGDDAAYGAVLQPDGKIVAAGGASGDFALARYNTDGSLDTSFDTNGTQTTDFGGGDVAHDAVLQPDGRVVVAGYSDQNSEFALARYNANGSPDTSFSTDGKQTTSFSDGDGATDTGYGLAVQANGKLIVAGEHDPPTGDSFALARLNPDGSLDGSFSGDGKQTTSFNDDDPTTASAVALQPDGKIVAAGTIFGGEHNVAIARYEGGEVPVVPSQQPGGQQPGGQQSQAGLLPGDCANARSGTAGKDTLNGTTAGDRLLGLAGNDILNGLQANDCLDGGAGNDRLAGGSGNDNLAGAAGADKLSGGSGKDRLAGGAGKDGLNAGAGNDRLDGGAGNDVIDGGSGDDALKGGAGNDRISGGTGRNSFSGGTGNDSIAAANGRRERINCGPGRDRVTADRTDRLTGCERVSRLRRAR